jgi:DNA-binding response OmpR family regulator
LVTDELEDWVRFPLDADELAVRTAVLADRARDVVPRPWNLVLDGDGVLHNGDRWVALAPKEERVCARLLDHAGEVVSRADLTSAAWPTTLPADSRAVDGVLKRLRRRIEPLGVYIHTVGRVGFLLDNVEEEALANRVR